MLYYKAMHTTIQKYSLAELCALLEMNKRTVRFYMQHGLVDRPDGLNRGAYYTQKHLEQLLEIKKCQRAGLSLDRIKEILLDQSHATPMTPVLRSRPGDVAVWSRLTVAPGVELHIEPHHAGFSPDKLKEFFRQVMEAHSNLCEKGDKND